MPLRWKHAISISALNDTMHNAHAAGHAAYVMGHHCINCLGLELLCWNEFDIWQLLHVHWGYTSADTRLCAHAHMHTHTHKQGRRNTHEHARTRTHTAIQMCVSLAVSFTVHTSYAFPWGVKTIGLMVSKCLWTEINQYLVSFYVRSAACVGAL